MNEMNSDVNFELGISCTQDLTDISVSDVDLIAALDSFEQENGLLCDFKPIESKIVSDNALFLYRQSMQLTRFKKSEFLLQPSATRHGE